MYVLSRVQWTQGREPQTGREKSERAPEEDICSVHGICCVWKYLIQDFHPHIIFFKSYCCLLVKVSDH